MFGFLIYFDQSFEICTASKLHCASNKEAAPHRANFWEMSDVILVGNGSAAETGTSLLPVLCMHDPEVMFYLRNGSVVHIVEE
jgi:hypothetical protein